MGAMIDLETRRLLVKLWRQEALPENTLLEFLEKRKGKHKQLNADEKRELLVVFEAVAERNVTVSEAEEGMKWILPEELEKAKAARR